MKGTILVTGASGFAGGHLLEHLGPAGRIAAWSRSAPRAESSSGTIWERVDLLDRDSVRAAVRALQPDAVYHLAGSTQVDRSWADPAGPLAANVLGTHYLLDALRRVGRPCRVLVTGSATVYAPSLTPLIEDSPIAPDSPYALSKLAQEALAVRAVEEDGLEIVTTRSFNHTGPGQAPLFVAPAIARQIALIERGALESVLRLGNVDAQRDLTDVRDVVRAYVALMDAGTPGEVYNVASGAGRSVRAIVDALVRLARISVRIEVDPAKLRPVDNPVLVGDASKLHRLTGWQPLIPFQTMLHDLLEYWRRAV